MSRINEIALEGMAFYAHHGYYTEERKRGNNYVIDVILRYNMESAALSDNLQDAMNYEEVYAVCKEEMENPRHLIESVARSIAHRIKERFPNTEMVHIRLSKLKPELGGSVAQATVRYSV